MCIHKLQVNIIDNRIICDLYGGAAGDDSRSDCIDAALAGNETLSVSQRFTPCTYRQLQNINQAFNLF